MAVAAFNSPLKIKFSSKNTRTRSALQSHAVNVVGTVTGCNQMNMGYCNPYTGFAADRYIPLSLCRAVTTTSRHQGVVWLLVVPPAWLILFTPRNVSGGLCEASK